MIRRTHGKLSMEVLFALGGLLLGFALLSYRSALPSSASTTNVDSTASASRRVSPSSSSSAPDGEGVSVTLGTAISVSDVATPKLESPEGDPLVPPSSPEADAILALKYYLLSDAEAEAKQLFESIPEKHRDLILRSALYAVWDRSDKDSLKGDWFRGDTNDPFTSRVSAQGAGHDPLTNTDNIDATPADARAQFRSKLAVSRIKLVQQLLNNVEPKTRAYWVPYLVIKLRRIATTDTEALIGDLVKDGNLAIVASLKMQPPGGGEHKIWAYVSRIGTSMFPLVLSALGFIMAKISQSTLTTIDRWIGARLSKIESETATDSPPTKTS